jgi:hypothetical protein
MKTGSQIDLVFLQKKFPEIARMAKNGETWDTIGIAMLRGFQRFGSRQQTVSRFRRGPAPTLEAEWATAKNALRRLFCSDSEDLRGIRQRLRDSSSTTTPLQLATLSLWLAGHLGKPVTMTTPLVATVLLGLVLDGEEVWRDLPAGLNA